MNKDTKHNLCDLPEEQYNEPQVDPALDLRKAKQAKVFSSLLSFGFKKPYTRLVFVSFYLL